MYTRMEEQLSRGLFNEAGYIIKRLHELQSRINSVRSNLISYNIEQNCYNYEIFFADLNSLGSEIWSKLTDEEQIELIKVKDLVRDSLKILPPHRMIRKSNGNAKQIAFNSKNWDKLLIFLEMYERLIKVASDAHGFSNPDMEGNDLF